MKKSFKRTFSINSKNEMVITETSTYTIPVSEGIDKILNTDYSRPKNIKIENNKNINLNFKDKDIKNICIHNPKPGDYLYFKNETAFVNQIITCPICHKSFRLLLPDEFVTFGNFDNKDLDTVIDNLFIYYPTGVLDEKELEKLIFIKNKINTKKKITPKDKEDTLKSYNNIQNYLITTGYSLYTKVNRGE